MNKIVFFLCLCLIITSSNVSAVCTKLEGCEEGQYCDGQECKACDHGFYQEKPIHRETACKPWTVRHLSENWIIEANGSSTKDVKWECMRGYVQRTFALGEIECVPQTTTTTSSIKTSTTRDSSTPIKTSLSTGATDRVITKEPKLEVKYLALIICICALILIALVIGCLIYHHRCFWQARRSSKEKGNNKDSIPLVRLNEFQKLISEIGLPKARKLIRIIPDPSCSFRAQKRLEFNRDNKNVTERYHAETLNEWVELNSTINWREYLAWTIDYINNGLSTSSNNERNGETPQLLLPPDETHPPISSEQSFHKLCYFVVENLGVEPAERFLNLLGRGSNVNVPVRFDHLKDDINELQTSFVDTLAEWKKSNSLQGTVATKFSENLNEIEQLNILNSSNYRLLISEFEQSLNSQGALPLVRGIEE